jgi:hypothetical protein
MSEPVPTSTPTPPASPRRPRATTWLLAALALALGGFLAMAWSRAQAQRSAVLAVEGLGGHVTYRNPAAKGGVRDLLGRDLFDPVYEVFLKDTQAGDADLEPLAELTRLETLDLTNAPITDAAVPTLARLRSLRRLYLTGTKLSPEGEQQLRQANPALDIIR